MSLEKAIQENTEAVKALTEAVTQFAASGNGSAAPTTSKAKDESPKEEKKADTKKADAKEEKKADAKKETKKDDKPDYESPKYLDEVKPLTLKVIKAKGRDAVAEVLANFGDDLKSAKDLTADQYDEYMEKLNAVLGDEDEDEDLA